MGAWPNHIKDQPGDRFVLCGADSRPNQFSAVWRKYAPDHRYPMQRCADCYTLAGLADMLTDDDHLSTMPALVRAHLEGMKP